MKNLEHYYDPESGSGYLAWRLKTIQRKTAQKRSVSVSKSPKVVGPGHGRSRPFTTDTVLSNEDVEAAVAVLRHSGDEDTIREKMPSCIIIQWSMMKRKQQMSLIIVYTLQKDSWLY